MSEELHWVQLISRFARATIFSSTIHNDLSSSYILIKEKRGIKEINNLEVKMNLESSIDGQINSKCMIQKQFARSSDYHIKPVFKLFSTKSDLSRPFFFPGNMRKISFRAKMLPGIVASNINLIKFKTFSIN